LLNAIAKNNALTTLQLHATHFGAAAFKNVLLGSQIQNLVLVDCWHAATPQIISDLSEAVAENVGLRDLALASLSDALLEALLESLKDHASVTKLRLSSHFLSTGAGRAIRELMDSDIQLTNLDICGSRLTEGTMKPVVDGLVSSKTVHTFSLSACSMDVPAVNCLNQLFRSSNIGLKHVNLSESITCANMLGDILSGLHRNTSIALLDISNCIFDPHEAAAHIKNLLRRNRHLTRLDIDRNSFPDADVVTTICDGLESNRSLEYLDCSRCDLHDDGCSIMLKSSRNLTHLIMCDNGMGLPCIQQYCELNATVLRSTLLHLILNGNNIGDAGAEQLSGLLKTGNSFLKALHVDHCGLTGNGFAALLAGVSQNSFLQHLSADCISLAEPENSSEAFCQGFVNYLPNCSLQSVSFSVSEARSRRPLEQQQKDVLRAFDRNTSLVKVHAGMWLFSSAQRKKYISYFVVRNQVMPFVNNKEENQDGFESSKCKKRKAPNDNNNESNIFPRGLWPRLMEKLLLSSAGTSAAFLALRSRPDLLVTDETTASPYKKWRQS
jgi:Ran GTPase-activating protein (RanGAP) involved in mRNA processing and transport